MGIIIYVETLSSEKDTFLSQSYLIHLNCMPETGEIDSIETGLLFSVGRGKNTAHGNPKKYWLVLFLFFTSSVFWLYN